MTYWAVVGLSHALDFHRESQERELTAAQLADAARRGAAAGAAAAAAPALPVQHAAHDLGADAPRHRRGRRDAGAAQRPAAADARPRRHAAGAAQGRARLRREVPRDRAARASATGCTVHIDVEPDTLDAAVPNSLLQPLVENALRHGIAPEGRRRPRGGRARAATASGCGWWCATTASACRRQAERVQHRRRPEQHALAARAPVSATATASSSRRRRAAGWR